MAKQAVSCPFSTLWQEIFSGPAANPGPIQERAKTGGGTARLRFLIVIKQTTGTDRPHSGSLIRPSLSATASGDGVVRELPPAAASRETRFIVPGRRAEAPGPRSGSLPKTDVPRYLAAGVCAAARLAFTAVFLRLI